MKKVLKILAIIIVVLILLGAALTVYLQQFLVFSGDGVRLELPFLQEEPVEETPAPSPTDSVVPPVEVVTPEPEPEPEPEPAAMQPVLLPEAALYDGTALEQIEANGGDCALFDMKNDSGRLVYCSQVDLAVAAKLTVDIPAINATTKALNETDGLYTVARISCFKDHGIQAADPNMAIFTNSGYRWTDPDNIRWISPTNPDVRDYLTAVCVELAGLGFDEILLDNAGYPNRGNLHYIKKGEAYDETQFAAVIDGFYAQVIDALAEYDVKLSVVTTPEAMAGLDSLTGQTPENLARFDRFWTVNEAGVLLPVTLSGFEP